MNFFQTGTWSGVECLTWSTGVEGNLLSSCAHVDESGGVLASVSTALDRSRYCLFHIVKRANPEIVLQMGNCTVSLHDVMSDFRV
jgi:hypothetical protein